MIRSEGATSLINAEAAILIIFMLLVKTIASAVLHPCISYVAIRTLVATIGWELTPPSSPTFLLSRVISK